MSYEYIFILYSCEKNIEKTNKTYEKIYDKISNTKVYIIYGDTSIDEKYIIKDDKYIILNVKDDYDHLSNKTILLIECINRLFPSIKGMFKCDDDIIINLSSINNTINDVENIDYAGKIIVIREKNKESRYPIYPCIYCGGPLYFLSKKAIESFKFDVKLIYYEDIMVGYHLNKNNIFPNKKYDLYSDQIVNSNIKSYHNVHHYEEFYLKLQGGLGNQLFQLACAMTISKKYNKKLTLNVNHIIPNPHQKNNIDITLNTIKKIFPQLSISNTMIERGHFCTYKEDKNECFLFNSEKIDKIVNVYHNIILEGFFINYK